MCLQVFFSTFFGASYKAYLQTLQKAYYQSYQVNIPSADCAAPSNAASNLACLGLRYLACEGRCLSIIMTDKFNTCGMIQGASTFLTYCFCAGL